MAHFCQKVLKPLDSYIAIHGSHTRRKSCQTNRFCKKVVDKALPQRIRRKAEYTGTMIVQTKLYFVGFCNI